MVVRPRPASQWKCAQPFFGIVSYGEYESIDLFVERARMIGNSEPDIGGAIGLHKLTFRTRLLNNHRLGRCGTRVCFFDRFTGANSDFAPKFE